MRCLFRITLALAACAAAFPTHLVLAASGVQVTRDGRYHLISKDVGNERWAIAYEVSDKTMTGNVFRSDGGEPAFLSCDTMSESSTEVTIRCYGADRCPASPCDASAWHFIADATLPLQFFFPPGALATPGPVATPTAKPTPKPTATAAPTDPLSALIGTWNMSFTIISTFTDTYRLQSVFTSNGSRFLRGLDQYGDPVVAGSVQELTPGSSLPYDFALLDPGFAICDFHLFNRTGTTSVSGVTIIVATDSAGQCDGSTPLGGPYDMSGSRVSTAAAVPTSADRAGDLTDARDARDVLLEKELTAGPTGVAPASSIDLDALVRSLQH
jgi:hypothetical protein